MSRLVEYGAEWLPILLVALRHTLAMAGLALLLSILGGALLSLARLSRSSAIRCSADGYVMLLRGTPLLALLFFLYFGLTQLGVVMSSFQAAIIGLSLINAAYVAEILRAGLASIPRGQFEAGRMIGLRHYPLARHVIVPQMLPLMIPPMINQSIILIKETSVASLIAAPELMLRSRELASETFMPLEIYLLVGMIYLAMILPLAALGRMAEGRLRTR